MKVIFIYDENSPALQSGPMTPEVALEELMHWDCPKIPDVVGPATFKEGYTPENTGITPPPPNT